MQHSKFIGAFMQPFPHFDTGDVLETGFVDELYISFITGCTTLQTQLF